MQISGSVSPSDWGCCGSQAQTSPLSDTHIPSITPMTSQAPALESENEEGTRDSGELRDSNLCLLRFPGTGGEPGVTQSMLVAGDPVPQEPGPAQNMVPAPAPPRLDVPRRPAQCSLLNPKPWVPSKSLHPWTSRHPASLLVHPGTRMGLPGVTTGPGQLRLTLALGVLSAHCREASLLAVQLQTSQAGGDH